MRHVGAAIANDLAFHAVIPVGIVGHIVLHLKTLLTFHQGGEFQIFRPHRRTRAPTCAVVNPSASLWIQWIVGTLLHDFPAPLLFSVHLHAVRVVAEFSAIVALAKVMAACARLQPPHRLTLSRDIGVRQHRFIPIAQVMQAFPKGIYPLDITRWRPFDEGKLEVQEFLPVSALQLHTVLQQRSVIGDVKHPSPPIRSKRKVDAVRGDVPRQFVTVDDFERSAPIRQGLIVVGRGLPLHWMHGERVPKIIQHVCGAACGPSVVQVHPAHIVSLHLPLCQGNRGPCQCSGHNGLPNRCHGLRSSLEHKCGALAPRCGVEECLSGSEWETPGVPMDPSCQGALVRHLTIFAQHVDGPQKGIGLGVVQQCTH